MPIVASIFVEGDGLLIKHDININKAVYNQLKLCHVEAKTNKAH